MNTVLRTKGNFIIKTLILCSILILSPVLQSEEIETSEVLVSATRTERSKKDVSVSIDSVQEEEVKKTPAQSVLEVLRDVPGVTISDNGGNGIKYIRMPLHDNVSW
ncbi:MAG: TonB-dependent receptor plug domain-containing protein [Verrucomicrobiota bacterium]|nr:TonB-dependent receptor plug domain-containing protein [Verrucomicrobiota bacterium]